MAYSRIKYTGDGTTDTYQVAFALGYLQKADVTCRVGYEITGIGTPLYRTLTWITDELVRIEGPVPALGQTILFDRTVPVTELLVDYEDGDTLTEANLNRSQKQMIMAIHQVMDGRLNMMSQDLDMGNNRITNLATPTDEKDAVTKKYVDDMYIPVQEALDDLDQAITDAQDARDRAEDAADRAETAASLLESGFIFTNVAQMQAASIPGFMTTVSTKGYFYAGDSGGGSYIRVSGTAVALSGNTGWIRCADRFMPDGTVDEDNGGWWELRVNECNLRQFGARGNYQTDDTTALQHAINFVGRLTQVRTKTLFVPAGSYRFEAGVEIPSTANHFFLLGTGSGEGVGTTKFYVHHPMDSSMPVFLHSKIQNLTMLRISFEQVNVGGVSSTSLPTILPVLCKRPPTALADVDTVITECRFNNFNKTLEHWGRGLEFTNNTVSISDVCIDLQWPDVGDYVESAAAISKDATGYRAFVISGNRFHSIGSIAVSNSGPNAHKIHAVQISDNLMDIGRRLFDGVLVDGLISDNVCTMTPIKAMRLLGGSKNYYIGDMVIGGNTDAGRVPDYFIEFVGEHTNGTISNLNLNNCSSDAIRASAGSKLTGVQFNDIVCGTVGGGVGATSNVIRLVGAEHDIVVNNLRYNGQVLERAIRIDAGSKVAVNGYTAATASPLGTQPGVHSKKVCVGDMSSGSNVFLEFISYSGTALGSMSYESAGTNGITLRSLSGSINLAPQNNSVRPMTDNTVSLGISTLRFANIHASVFRQNSGIGVSVNPTVVGQLVVETTSNTVLTFKLMGSDSVVRTGTLTLS